MQTGSRRGYSQCIHNLIFNSLVVQQDLCTENYDLKCAGMVYVIYDWEMFLVSMNTNVLATSDLIKSFQKKVGLRIYVTSYL